MRFPSKWTMRMRSKVSIHRRKENRRGNAMSLVTHFDPVYTGLYGEELLSAKEEASNPQGDAWREHLHLPLSWSVTFGSLNPLWVRLSCTITGASLTCFVLYYFLIYATVSTFLRILIIYLLHCRKGINISTLKFFHFIYWKPHKMTLVT